MLGQAFPDILPSLHHSITQSHQYGNSWLRLRPEWLEAAGIAFTNVLNFRPPDNKIPAICIPKTQIPASYDWPALSKGLYLDPSYLPEIDRLFYEIQECRPNLIVALGNTAIWALLRTTAIASIRGTITTAGQHTPFHGLKLLPSYHPATVLYQYSLRPIVVADLIKASYESQFPEIRRPQREIKIGPWTIEEWTSECQSILRRQPALLGCDTETSLGIIDTIGFSLSASEGLACHFGPHRIARGTGYYTVWPFRDGQNTVRYWSHSEEVQFWLSIKEVLESGIPILFQNGVYDLQYFIKAGIRPKNVLHDTMLLHHSLFPEMQKGLGFLGSIYTNEASWKSMRTRSDSIKRDE